MFGLLHSNLVLFQRVRCRRCYGIFLLSQVLLVMLTAGCIFSAPNGALAVDDYKKKVERSLCIEEVMLSTTWALQMLETQPFYWETLALSIMSTEGSNARPLLWKTLALSTRSKGTLYAGLLCRPEKIVNDRMYLFLWEMTCVDTDNRDNNGQTVTRNNKSLEQVVYLFGRLAMRHAW